MTEEKKIDSQLSATGNSDEKIANLSSPFQFYKKMTEGFGRFEPEVIKMWTARKVENGELLGQSDDDDINHYHFFGSKEVAIKAMKITEKYLKKAGGEVAPVEIIIGYKKK